MSRESNLFKNTCNRCFLSYWHIFLTVPKVMKHDSVALMCKSTFSWIHKETPLCLCRYLFYGRKYKSEMEPQSKSKFNWDFVFIQVQQEHIRIHTLALQYATIYSSCFDFQTTLTIDHLSSNLSKYFFFQNRIFTCSHQKILKGWIAIISVQNRKLCLRICYILLQQSSHSVEILYNCASFVIICQVMANLRLTLCIYIFRRHGATLAFIWLDTIHFCPPNKCKSVHQKNIFPQENIWLISCYMLTRCLVRFIKSFLLKNANWKRSWWDLLEEREPYPVSRINVGSVRFSSTYWLHVSLCCS